MSAARRRKRKADRGGRLSAGHLSVIYVEGDKLGVRVPALEVDKDGEFRDQWPSGFFEERAGELF